MRKELLQQYRFYGRQREFRKAIFFSVFFFAISLVVFNFSEVYATSRASNYVEDIVLSNTPVFDVDFFFVYGAIALVLVIVGLGLVQPKCIPFMLYSLTLFIVIRSVFVSLTHIAPYPGRVGFDATHGIGSFTAQYMFGGDLFFSGHTGIPFLMALMFWQEKILRNIFLSWSIFFAITVLLGHLHYSIDVVAAFFITYSIYQIALWLFPKDYARFISNI